ncbi:unnamed protein product [Camellia sinensis]
MNTLSITIAPQIPKANIGRKKYQKYLTSGNSVTLLKMPNSSSYFSSSSKLVRTSTGKADSSHDNNHTHIPPPPHRDLQDKVISAMAASDSDSRDDRIARIASAIRVIPDFPKPGIMFQDITTLLLDPKAFKDTIDLFVERYKGKDISVVADEANLTLELGIEARGFIFGPPIALAIGAKFVPMRKPKKLPGEVISEEYSLEYGTDKMEMHVGAVQAGERALIIDDLIATGGTLCAAIRLLGSRSIVMVHFYEIASFNNSRLRKTCFIRVGVHVVECACVIELADLKGRERLGDRPLFVLVSST